MEIFYLWAVYALLGVLAGSHRHQYCQCAERSAWLAHRLDQARLKKVFAAFIAMPGLLMPGKSLSG